MDGNGFVRGPDLHPKVQQLTMKRSLGKQLWAGVGYFLALSFVIMVLFLLGLGCYAAWNAVVG